MSKARTATHSRRRRKEAWQRFGDGKPKWTEVTWDRVLVVAANIRDEASPNETGWNLLIEKSQWDEQVLLKACRRKLTFQRQEATGLNKHETSWHAMSYRNFQWYRPNTAERAARKERNVK